MPPRCKGTNIRKLQAQVHRATKQYKQKLQTEILQAKLSILKTQVHALETQLHGGLKNPPQPLQQCRVPEGVSRLQPIPRKHVNKPCKTFQETTRKNPVTVPPPVITRRKRLRKYFSPKDSNRPKSRVYSPVSKQPVIPRKKSKLIQPIPSQNPRVLLARLARIVDNKPVENKPVTVENTQQLSNLRQRLDARVQNLHPARATRHPRSKTQRILRKILRRDYKKYLAAKKDYDQKEKLKNSGNNIPRVL